MCLCVAKFTNNISFARKCVLVPSRFEIYRFSAIGRDNIIWKWRADAIRMPSFRPCWNVHSVVLNEYTSILRSAQSILNMRSTYLPIFFAFLAGTNNKRLTSIEMKIRHSFWSCSIFIRHGAEHSHAADESSNTKATHIIAKLGRNIYESA